MLRLNLLPLNYQMSKGGIMGIKSSAQPPVIGYVPVVSFVFGLVLVRSTALVIKATGAAIVTGCLLHLFRRGVFRDD